MSGLLPTAAGIIIQFRSPLQCARNSDISNGFGSKAITRAPAASMASDLLPTLAPISKDNDGVGNSDFRKLISSANARDFIGLIRRYNRFAGLYAPAAIAMFFRTRNNIGITLLERYVKFL